MAGALRLGLLLVGIALLGFGYLHYRRALTTPLPLEKRRSFEISRGESFSQVVHRLKQEGILTESWPLLLHAWWSGQARAVKAGEYLLKPGMTAKELLDLFVAGKVHQYRFAILEGWTVRDLLQAVERAPGLKKTVASVPQEKLLEALGLPPGHPEGCFFPDTYFYIKGMSDRELLRRAYRRMERILQRLWRERSPDLPIRTPYEALILASIVQKESGDPKEQPLIAAVFHNRLRLGMPLQADPTVIYGLGEEFSGRLTRGDLKRDTPYNTYIYKGLPPTPIALPGESAIRAVLRPAASDALFFVANGKGGHTFSKRYEEHIKAVHRYRKRRSQRPNPPQPAAVDRPGRTDEAGQVHHAGGD